MIPTREEFLEKVCYTPLVFGRVTKKLVVNMSIADIKNLVNKIIIDPETTIIKEGKNYYLQNKDIELVINSYNFRLITANRK
ncbi:DUF3781 domain-containing protein [Companilactobacillus kimchiensis]|uniref:DUF3781 domain-containing protein n=1 Tax=Companilactobacillus kimchiensis TaxID=993692 RepID=A0A0R2LKE4_9LACO|nr:DUF3781 domain-containing protein [Companilactobacillus kimchiensis]KRN98644.1 hypothetical protein IV57_GL001063 [Companilactobacillus kimchiensis]